jgi:hypothetical protein
VFDVLFAFDTSFSIGFGCSFELVCHSLLRLLDAEDLLVFGVFLLEDIKTFSLNVEVLDEMILPVDPFEDCFFEGKVCLIILDQRFNFWLV